MQDSTAGLGIESHLLWWAMLLHRTLELAPILPPRLRGRIQIEVALESGAPAHFHLILCGARTSGGAGAIDAADAWVKTSESKLHALLFAAQPPADALLVSGETQLFASLLEVLKRNAAPKSLLEMRCGT